MKPQTPPMNMSHGRAAAVEAWPHPHLDLVSRIARLYADRAANGSTGGHTASRLLSDVACRLEALALLDDASAGGGARPGAVDLATYLCDIGHLVISSLAAEHSVALELSSSAACLVSARHAALLGQIAVGMVSNAVLYAHPAGVPGVIRIGCERGPDGALSMRVADDGVGLPEGMDASIDSGAEFQSMRLLCRQLGGELTFSSSCLGLHCQVSVPSLSIV